MFVTLADLDHPMPTARRPRSPVPVLLLPLLLGACALGAQPPVHTPAQSRLAEPPEPLQTEAVEAFTEVPPPRPIDGGAEAQYHILVGELALRRDEPETAARAFVAALRTIPDLELAQRATQLALRAEDEGLALEAAEAWLRMDPSAAEPREVILRVNLLRGRDAEAQIQARALLEGHAGGLSDGYRQLAVLLSRVPRGQAASALSLLDALAQEHPAEGGGPHALALLQLRFGQLGAAEASAKRALELEPEAREHGLLLAGIEARLGRLDEALARVEALLAEEAPELRAELRLAFARVVLDTGAREAGAAQLARVLEDDPNQIDARLLLGILSAEAGEHTAARGYLMPLLTTPRQQDAALQLGRLAEVEGQYEEALALYASITRGPTAIDALMRRAWVLGRLERADEAVNLLGQMRDDLPQLSGRLYLLEGELLINAGRADEAEAAYSAGLDLQPGQPDLLYARSLAYERLGRIADAEADLRAVLADNPEDGRALNALGYTLLIHTHRLDEAANLIERAIVRLPEDPAVMDSLGWLRFKQGRLDEARDWLERAYARLPDPGVGAHLGEVLWTLGEPGAAQRIWDEALDLAPDHPVLLDTLRRLRP